MEYKKVKLTINEALVLLRRVGSRMRYIDELVHSSAVEENRYYDDKKERIEKKPVYDIKKLDEYTIELEYFVMEAERAIKQANARTEIEVEVPGGDIKNLFKPLR